ncbi:mucin-5AC-like [Thalassophryne amazonica]|uniref:mucin-5AC-like n=1 Tax=Thalassophryne amazonica TaxID=390379 RepID=UPI0014716DD9|nr:mucin-5AC-like [Thalassophryne amazonica]XP_034048289.1 mucin-5AC-like [Thalassophryne amazonica]
MELLRSALIVALLTTSFAKPIRSPWHHRRNIAEKHPRYDWLGGHRWWPWWISEYDSSESNSAESDSSSSEEVVITHQTTTFVPFPDTTTTRGVSISTRNPTSMSTSGPVMTETTPLPGTTPMSVVTSTNGVTTGVTKVVSVSTTKRGDN